MVVVFISTSERGWCESIVVVLCRRMQKALGVLVGIVRTKVLFFVLQRMRESKLE